MKKAIVLILISFLALAFNKLNAQDTEQTIPKDSIFTYNDLPTDEARLAWNDMHDEWRQNNFHDCLDKAKLKMSCAHCSSIYLTVDFKIDSAGKVLEYRIVKENMCGNDFTESLKKCFLEYFLTIPFPESLRNMVFEITIGNGLKC
ncbi:MAG TPA: hypothetical protein PKI01_03555 [Bacteroidales bacterium]|nr:hypothetical protein [Bacteroidales bacterium]